MKGAGWGPQSCGTCGAGAPWRASPPPPPLAPPWQCTSRMVPLSSSARWCWPPTATSPSPCWAVPAPRWPPGAPLRKPADFNSFRNLKDHVWIVVGCNNYVNLIVSLIPAFSPHSAIIEGGAFMKVSSWMTAVTEGPTGTATACAPRAPLGSDNSPAVGLGYCGRAGGLGYCGRPGGHRRQAGEVVPAHGAARKLSRARRDAGDARRAGGGAL